MVIKRFIRGVFWASVLLLLAACSEEPMPTPGSTQIPPLIFTPTAGFSTRTPLTRTPTPALMAETAAAPTEPAQATGAPAERDVEPPGAGLSAAELQATIDASRKVHYAAMYVENDLVVVAYGNEMVVLDVTVPDEATVLSIMTFPIWIERVQVVGSTVYALLHTPIWEDAEAGLMIVDITDPENPVELSYYYPGFTATDVVILDGVAHIIGATSRWDAVVVSDPAAPVHLGTIIGGGYWDCHGGGTSFYRITAAGGYINIFNGPCRYGGRYINIYDVSDPANVEKLGVLGLNIGQKLDVAYRDNLAYTFKGYLYPALGIYDVSEWHIDDFVGEARLTTNDNLDIYGKIILIGDYAYIAGVEGTSIVDISDPANPALVDVLYPTADFSDFQAVDGYLYLLDWDQGLVILDVSDPGSPVEVGRWQR